ncbi:MAG: prepilin-type N-terminal cleavage/methylation domain-containing protein [Desulfatiglans sp.]|nr:prepilin-type N-terminal cleavage/methylation domain-containing protein [Desulfatiglans sp.]
MNFKDMIEKDLMCKGFSLLELLFVLCIAGILATVATPVFSTWIPDYRLRAIAKELYADMHLAKMRSIKENDKYKIVFNTEANNSYSFIRADGVIEKTVFFNPAASDSIVAFGYGKAIKDATKTGGSPPADGVSYAGNAVTFNPRGTGTSGYVYLANSKGSSFAVGTLSSGVIHIKKWDKNSKSWR